MSYPFGANEFDITSMSIQKSRGSTELIVHLYTCIHSAYPEVEQEVPVLLVSIILLLYLEYPYRVGVYYIWCFTFYSIFMSFY